MWGLRVSMPKRSMWRVAQFDTLRLRLIKITTPVVELKTMIRVHLPTSCPAQHIFHYALGQIPPPRNPALRQVMDGACPPISEPFPINPPTSASHDASQPPAKEKRVREAIIPQRQHVQIAFFPHAGLPAELCGLARYRRADLFSILIISMHTLREATPCG